MSRRAKCIPPNWEDLAHNYLDKVISPFAPEVSFRLHRDVRAILGGWAKPARKVVADFGCGCGNGVLEVAGHVGAAIGIDISQAMLDQCALALAEAGVDALRYSAAHGATNLNRCVHGLDARDAASCQTFLVRADMQRLTALHNRVDLGLAINSITQPSKTDVDRIFAEVSCCLKRRATLIAVFPSQDTMFHLHRLADKHRERLPRVGYTDPKEGIYYDPAGDQQKFFLPEEIRALFRRHGWRIDVMEKIRYPWQMIKKFGWGCYPHHERLWDWYVLARRTTGTT